jgi:hypothetical protein
MPDRDKQSEGGYAERGPGRGDYPGRGDGTSKGPQPEAEGELSGRSRWRDSDADERSDRWSGQADEALDPEIPDEGEAGKDSATAQDGDA